MDEADDLSSVLRDFARTMLTDFRIQGILDHLVERIVEILSISGAGVTLISTGVRPRYVAASGEAALRFERLQTILGQGPCLTAFESGEPVAIADLSADDSYPEFGPAAVGDGLAAVFAFPLMHGSGRLGALDLYRDTPGQLSPRELSSAQTLADVAAAYLLNAQARELLLETSARFQASTLHDALTGLPNRFLLQQRLEHAAARAVRTRGRVAVLFADLDRFTRINDSHGHDAGDRLLVAVADRLATLVRPGDTLARVSGDEFVVLCEDIEDDDEARVLAERIKEAFTVPFVVSGVQHLLTVSVGLAYSGPGEEVTYRLVLDADTAMRQAKRTGGATHHVIDLRAAAQDRARDQLEAELRAALLADELDVAYQPIVRVSDGFVVGVESLLRWTDPVTGPVMALLAVSAAEQSSLIVDIGGWVLERGCRDRTRWLAEHPEQPLELAINVSARQLLAPGFVATVAATLQDTGTDPRALVLEVTEGIFIEDGARALRLLNELRALGVRMALDDFGTGYSSLSYLRRFPFDSIKIDQGFVADLTHDPTAAAIVSAVTRLTHDLGMTVTAEGVETRQQRDRLNGLGCEYAQGYLYARPLSAPAVTAALEESDSRLLHLP